jgi:hypothetical protein
MNNNNIFFRLETKNETEIISAHSPIEIGIKIITNQPLSRTWLVHLYDNQLDEVPFKSLTARGFMAIYEPLIEEHF